MTTSITVARTVAGDDQVHMSGCAHLTHRSKFEPARGWGTFAGATIVDAIIAADTDMAAAFCQKVYEVDEVDPAWTTSVMYHAPCFKAATKSVGWDSVTGKPVAL